VAGRGSLPDRESKGKAHTLDLPFGQTLPNVSQNHF
ncbi:MAG: hypothetical protein JWQ42_563, partial [Edaphobacter sp.]|nr:hypothetical protein [Edaphobacter sp.]